MIIIFKADNAERVIRQVNRVQRVGSRLVWWVGNRKLGSSLSMDFMEKRFSHVMLIDQDQVHNLKDS